MDASELLPIRNFINELPPFDQLNEALLNQCCLSLSIGYYSVNDHFVHVDTNEPQLYIVRSGAFEVTTETGELLDRISDGQFFGFSGLLSGEKIVNKVKILEDGLIYHLPLACFDKLRSNSKSFDRFFNQAFAKRLRHQGTLKNNDINTSHIARLISPSLISIKSDATTQQAALLMSNKRVSSIAVIDNETLIGIVTDRDLRNRVLAKGLDGTTPITQIMTKDPLTASKNTLIFEAMLLMSEKSIHHLPIVDNGVPIAMLTSTDIMRSQSSQPLLLISQINRQNDIESLKNISIQINLLLQNLINSDAKAQDVGRILTSVTDTLTRRLIYIAEKKLGSPPIKYCWLSFGSQARQDQAAGSDQDNALLLESKCNDEQQVYFKNLTEMVCFGLNECGYIYCPGDIMAQNPKWQMSLKQWKSTFSNWISQPDPSALLNATIFFDMRPIHGDHSLFTQLQTQVLKTSKGNDIFIAALTANAMQNTPPLGFFKGFVIERDGSEVKGIDLKHKGIALINDIARIYALSYGIDETNTSKRLLAVSKQTDINKKDILNLFDAHQFISQQRLLNQGSQHVNDHPLTNYLLPENLSSLHRHQLKDAFKVVFDAQKGLKLRFLRTF